jgi:hypothetical protein
MLQRRVFKVAGVTFEGRQEHIAKLSGGEPCKIVPEPTNPYDRNALAVHVAHGGMIYHVGYVPRDIAAVVAVYLDGESLIAKVVEVTGGFETREGDTASLGLRVMVEFPLDAFPLSRKGRE